jgi:protein-disulfide isomerase
MPPDRKWVFLSRFVCVRVETTSHQRRYFYTESTNIANGHKVINMKNIRLIPLAVLSLLLMACSGMQTSGKSIQSELETIKQDQAALRKDVDEINKRLNPPKRSQIDDVDVTLNVANDPRKGEDGAKLTLVEFTDYQCPYCARHVNSVMPQLMKDYVDSGKIRYVIRDFPLPFHSNAANAALAAHCAGEQGKYWEMHDKLFDNQRALDEKDLLEYAKALEIDSKRYMSCLTGDKYRGQIAASVKEGGSAGISGTPSFLIGYTQAGGDEVKARKIIRGAFGYDVFKQAIDGLLKEKN